MEPITLVTDARPFAADVQAELKPLFEAFSARGVTVQTRAWDDPTVDWAAAGLSVLRTPWNYHRHVREFVAWAKRVPRLLNPASVVEWNATKTYLRELGARGVPVTETEWLTGEVQLDEVLERRGWAEAVLKPSVSAGSFRTKRFRRGSAPQALLTEILRECTAMLQPYLASVETSGERSLVFFGGELSHAVKRHPPLQTGLHGGTPVSAASDELEVARAALATQPELLYARVDVARDAGGGVRLMELELIEPSLFLETAAGSADRFVEAVLKRAGA
ncbi:MAG: hypothetical protein JNK82_45785 [Myxococcaceae bacterium]|nr:hypothetical protein [Myxococcaceae bacterium]